MRQTDESPAGLAHVDAEPGLEGQPSSGDSMTPPTGGEEWSQEGALYGNWTPKRRQARLAEIEQLLATSTESTDDQATLYRDKALLLFADQHYQAAVEAWDQYLAVEPAQAQGWYNRGIALDRLGFHGPALESYDRVIELQPANHIAWGNRAIALRKLGRDGEAAEAARRAFELNPEDMVDSFFKQLRSKYPKLAFVLGPVQGLVTRLRGA